MALTPLLPFATNPLLVSAAQILAAVVVAGILGKTTYLCERPMHSYMLVYATFLSLNFVVYDYYWVDVVFMILILAIFWLKGNGGEGNQRTSVAGRTLTGKGSKWHDIPFSSRTPA
jgi:hypothetical protein